MIARSGYTGEDGFEISMPAANAAVDIAETLMATGEVTLAGLGARDTLRLEAGLPLWGHELGRDHYPDHGRATIRPVKESGVKRPISPAPMSFLTNLHAWAKAAALSACWRAGARPVRDGTILFHDGVDIGVITSGGFSPSLDRPAALGFG